MERLAWENTLLNNIHRKLPVIYLYDAVDLKEAILVGCICIQSTGTICPVSYCSTTSWYTSESPNGPPCTSRLADIHQQLHMSLMYKLCSTRLPKIYNYVFDAFRMFGIKFAKKYCESHMIQFKKVTLQFIILGISVILRVIINGNMLNCPNYSIE